MNEKIFILAAMLGLMGFMWWSLAKDVASRKPFELDKQWYQCEQTKKP